MGPLAKPGQPPITLAVPPSVRPTWVEVDRGALLHNVRRIRDLVGDPCRILAVVKADAYGHGAVYAARAFCDAGVWGLAVSLVEEALELRAAGIAAPLVVLGGVPAGAEDTVVATGLRPVVWTADQIDRLEAAARRQSAASVPVHLKVDTGMSRLGVRREELSGLLDRLALASRVTVEGLMTHFARAGDDDGEADTRAQWEAFVGVAPQVAERLRSPRPILHAANSAALLRFPWARLDMVRPGIALLGAGPSPAHTVPGLAPVLSFHAKVVGIRSLPAGARVGYGGKGVLARPSRLAVVPVGYADGYPHALSGRAHVLVDGRPCPLVGDVSMDITMVDVTDVPAAGEGAPVTLLGRQGAGEISLGQFAAWAGLLPYEVPCGISKRVPRHAR